MKLGIQVALPAMFLLMVWSGFDCATAEKLSVILPGKNTEFNIGDDHVDFDIRSSGGLGLSIPLPPSGGAPPTPTSPQLVLDAPPATVPTGPPGIRIGNNAAVSLQSSIPTINALYDVPDAGSEQQTIQGACQAETVIVTSRATVTSTRVSVSQVDVPTTVYQNRVVTSTDTRFQTNFQTSFVTVQAPPQTRIQTRTVTSEIVRSQTVFRTTTQVQQQLFTSTKVQVSTQVVTRPVTQEVTITSLRTEFVSVPVTSLRTVYSTQVVTSRLSEPTYITVTSTQTQYQPNTCVATGSSSSGGYTYPTPGGSVSTGSGYYGGSSSAGTGSHYGTGYYGSTGGSSGYSGSTGGTGGYYAVGYPGGSGGHYRRPIRYNRSKNKGLFGKWFK